MICAVYVTSVVAITPKSNQTFVIAISKDFCFFKNKEKIDAVNKKSLFAPKNWNFSTECNYSPRSGRKVELLFLCFTNLLFAEEK